MRSIYLELTGGFGNQLFQWAAAQTIVREWGEPLQLVYDVRMFSRPGARGFALAESGLIANQPLLTESIWARSAWAAARRGPSRVHRALHNAFPIKAPARAKRIARSVPEVYRALGEGLGPIWMRGYFQQPRAFWSLRPQLTAQLSSALASVVSRTDTLFSELPLSYNAIHIRRGDYSSHPWIGVCGLDYYRNSIAYLDSRLPYLVISDDDRWASVFVLPALPSGSRVLTGQSDMHDFEVLRRAQGIAISNSTFSWWAAFSGAATAIVAPSPWHDKDEYDPDMNTLLATVLLDKHTGARVGPNNNDRSI